MSNKVLGFALDENSQRVILVREVVNYEKKDLQGIRASVADDEDPRQVLVDNFLEKTNIETTLEDWTKVLTVKNQFEDLEIYKTSVTYTTISSLADLAGFLDHEVRVWDLEMIARVLANSKDDNPGFPREYGWIIPLMFFKDKNYEPFTIEEAFDVEKLFD